MKRFHTEQLACLLESDQTFGFIVMDGSCTLFGTLSGNNRVVKQIITVDLPKKHGRGGQSALRFARLRLEKRHNYLRKVAELATVHFITNDVPNVKGLVLAGLSLFKNDLSKSDLFDPRLSKVVVWMRVLICFHVLLLSLTFSYLGGNCRCGVRRRKRVFASNRIGKRVLVERPLRC